MRLIQKKIANFSVQNVQMTDHDRKYGHRQKLGHTCKNPAIKNRRKKNKTRTQKKKAKKES